MKRLLIVLFSTLLAVSFLIVGCGNKYSDAKKVTEEYIAMVEKYVEGLDQAGSSKDVVTAMNRFADGLEDLWPRMRKISEKYPELKDKSNPPEELKESQKRAEEMGMKLAGSMMKLMPYMKDPEVRAAQERLGKIMMNP